MDANQRAISKSVVHEEDNVDVGFCASLTSSSDKFDLFNAVFGLIQLLSIVLIVFWLVVQSALAKKGDASAAKRLIFPVYLWILVAFAFSILVQGLCNLLLPFDPAGGNDLTTSILFGFSYAINHVVIEGIAGLFMQQGCGIASIRRSIMFGIVWGAFVGTFHALATYETDKTKCFIDKLVWESTVVLFYTSLVLLPPSILYRRPAMKYHATFWALFRFIMIISNMLLYLEKDSGYCLYYFSAWIVFGLLKPFVIYEALLRDCMYWQGLLLDADPEYVILKRARLAVYASIKNCLLGNKAIDRDIIDDLNNEASQKSLNDIRTPLLGVHLSKSSANILAVTLDDLRSNVNLINFGFIAIDSGVGERKVSHIIGEGASARVFRGRYEGRPVAIKLVYCVELGQREVSNFCREASLLASLSHPNIVQLYGVCIIPPTLTLVMELCSCSLYEYLKRHRASSDENSLPWTRQTQMMRDCAESINYLHSQTPPILHRDIKSLNYLVADDMTIKLSDLELSRQDQPDDRDSDNFLIATLAWTAPEILNHFGHKYTDKSDVYSLGIVLWEILTCKEPFADTSLNELNEFVDAICVKQLRPPLPSSTPRELEQLLTSMWIADPSLRPTSRAVRDAIVHSLTYVVK